MAASSSTDARASSSAERFTLLRELGSSANPVWAALEAVPDARPRLIALQRLSCRSYAEAQIAQWLRDARGLLTLEHPNVVRVRDVVVGEEDVSVASDFVDGVRWSELAVGPQRPSLELGVRMLVDVLSGLSAIHNWRDARRQPLKLVHGELTPESILIALDGEACIVGAHRFRGTIRTHGATASRYLAPEILRADAAADARADVYSVGVLLWEILSGRPFANTASSATQTVGGSVPRASVPAASPWALPLADAAARALSPDPQKRFGSAAAFAAELRRVAGAKLAPTARAAGLVRGAYGELIRARRDALERGEVTGDEVSRVEPRTEPPPPGPMTVEKSPPKAATVHLEVPVDLERTIHFDFDEQLTPPFPPAAAPTKRPLPLRRIVPLPPGIPEDLAGALFATSPPDRHWLSPLPAPPSTPALATGGESLRLTPRGGRRTGVVAVVAGAALVMALLIAWWLTARAPGGATVAEARPPIAAAPVPVPARAVVAAPPLQRPAAETAVAASLQEETPPTEVRRSEESPSVPSATAAPALVIPRAAPSPGPAAARPKYEPEGI